MVGDAGRRRSLERFSKRIGDLIDIAFGAACIFSFNLDWIE
jgi:hypothetical protein